MANNEQGHGFHGCKYGAIAQQISDRSDFLNIGGWVVQTNHISEWALAGRVRTASSVTVSISSDDLIVYPKDTYHQ